MIMTNSNMGGLGGGMTGGGLLNNMKQPLLGGPGQSGPHGLHHSNLQQNGPLINARVGMVQPNQQQQHMGPRGTNLMGAPRMQAPPGMQLGKSFKKTLNTFFFFTNQFI